MKKQWAMLAALLAMSTKLALCAERGEVITKDGGVLRGEVTVEGDQVRVNREGIVSVLSTDAVKEIRTASQIAEAYKRQLADLDDKDWAGHLKLAEWCLDRGMIDAAKERCGHVLTLDIENAEAKRILGRINQQSVVPSDARRATKKEPGKPATDLKKGDLLSKEQISRIRMAEFRPGDRVSVRFKNDVLQRFLDAVAGTEPYNRRGYREEFMAKAGSEKLEEILKATGMHFADDIEVTSDPEAIQIFRREVMPVIRTGCASLSCHGGVGAPKIRLHSVDTPAAVYTYFYALDTYKGPKGVKMIDRTYPEEGLLTQYLLPNDIAESGLAHPGDVPPTVRDRSDRRYDAVVSWIKDGLRNPRLDPGIEPDSEARTNNKPTTTRSSGAPPARK